ncbi:hypothetical protein RRG08_023398 [Elysia crispata]|uniref:Uncharacterized protein n=1 Tax=Elysia crispata TaxID=231223 RepID=A0AAE0YDW3_9GAST|nr:hypothetical protein RRG08_023398 [Elysia crispata]
MDYRTVAIDAIETGILRVNFHHIWKESVSTSSRYMGFHDLRQTGAAASVT